jgi:hypothetical protein
MVAFQSGRDCLIYQCEKSEQFAREKMKIVTYFDNWRNSQVRAKVQRRSAAPRLMPIASAAS